MFKIFRYLQSWREEKLKTEGKKNDHSPLCVEIDVSIYPEFMILYVVNML